MLAFIAMSLSPGPFEFEFQVGFSLHRFREAHRKKTRKKKFGRWTLHASPRISAHPAASSFLSDKTGCG
jgi:hypothetical protein